MGGERPSPRYFYLFHTAHGWLGEREKDDALLNQCSQARTIGQKNEKREPYGERRFLFLSVRTSKETKGRKGTKRGRTTGEKV